MTVVWISKHCTEKALYQVIPIRRHHSHDANSYRGLVSRYNVPFHVQMRRDMLSVSHPCIACHDATTTTLCTIAVYCAKVSCRITTVVDNTTPIRIRRIISYGTVRKDKLSMQIGKNSSASEKCEGAFKGIRSIDGRCCI